jgi:hypothetical protein
VSVLAHVFEAAGIATITLSSVKEMAEKVSPPRTLHCEFPLGRPLGKPDDAAFQHDVLARAFALLEATSGPVFVVHPEVIEADDQPMSCALPPRFDPTLPAAVDEARGLRKAYDRTLAKRAVTSLGRTMSADEVPETLAKLVSIADGADWTTVGLPDGSTTAVCHDIRTYYEEAALALVNGPVPGGRAMEDWYYSQTEAGKTVLAARTAMRVAGVKRPIWFYMAPGHR